MLSRVIAMSFAREMGAVHASVWRAGATRQTGLQPGIHARGSASHDGRRGHAEWRGLRGLMIPGVTESSDAPGSLRRRLCTDPGMSTYPTLWWWMEASPA